MDWTHWSRINPKILRAFINKSGDIIDYDRPTTIKNYLNYLKDTKNDINRIDKIIYDDNGKIKELDLFKMK